MIQIPGPGLALQRGWCAVDVFVRGERFRFICTHLEEEPAPDIQMLPAMELIDGPANVRLPVILAGEFNADPRPRNGVSTFAAFAAAGIPDAWARMHPNDLTGGLTWGHDGLLADPSVALIWRIDLVLYRGLGFAPYDVQVLDLGLNRTEPPLWASDHAFVTADFFVRQLRPQNPPAHSPKLRARIGR